MGAGRALSSQWLTCPASALGPNFPMVLTLVGENTGRPRTGPLK